MADSLIFTAEKSLKDAGDKVAPDLKKEVEEKISVLKAILETGTKEDIEAKTKDLSDSLQKVGQAMSQQSGQQSGNPSASSGQASGNGEQKTDKEDKSDSAKSTSDKEEPVEGEVVN